MKDKILRYGAVVVSSLLVLDMFMHGFSIIGLVLLLFISKALKQYNKEKQEKEGA